MLRMQNGLSAVFLPPWGVWGVLSEGNTNNGMREARTQGRPRQRAQHPQDKSSASKQKRNTKSAVR